MSDSKRDNLNNIVMLIVLFMALHINRVLPGLQNSAWYIPVSMLTATGVYVFFMKAILLIASKSEILMRFYWGQLYLSGYWSYKYTRDGKVYFGIWRFEQDLNNIRVVGSGLNDNYSPRTIVRSVSPLIEDQGAYFVLNVRTELDKATGFITPVYSKTTLILDAPRGFKPVVTMRATTEVYGGVSTGQLHPDVMFKKHIDANSDEDVIQEIKKLYDHPSEANQSNF